MRRDILKVLVMLLAITLIIMLGGCQGSTSPQETTPKEQKIIASPGLKNLAQKEEEFLLKLEPLKIKVSEQYELWEKGRISRSDLNGKYMELLPKVNEVRYELKDYMEKNPLSEEEKNDQLYKDGLQYGKDLALFISGFITEVEKGNPEVTVDLIRNAKQLNDEQVKNAYKSLVIEKYNEKLSKVQSTINKLK